MSKKFPLENVNGTVCEITMQVSLNSVDSKLLKPTTTYGAMLGPRRD